LTIRCSGVRIADDVKPGEKVERVVVIGAAGFIGTAVASKLREDGIETMAIDRLGEGTRVVRADILDQQTIQRLLEPGDSVIHLATSSNPGTSELDRIGDIETSLIGTLRLLDACVERNVSRFVLASSGGTVYGIPETTPIPETHPTNPISSHGALKLAIEKYVQAYGAQFGLSYVILRCTNAYGPRQTGKSGQGIIGRAISTAVRGDTLEIWGDGTVVRDFVYVADVAEAFLLAASTAAAQGVMNIGSGKGTSVNEIIDLVGQATGRPLPVRYTGSRKFDVPANVLDITKAGSILNWTPTTALLEGISRCYSWARGHISELAS
jgi:UDP-glucose 4-epimerase